MNAAIELPEDIGPASSIVEGHARRALEAIALEGCRTQALTRGQVGRLLGLNFWEMEAFLKERRAYLPYDESDLDRDRQAIDQALSE
jgi:predicted HTH domain antitoxin